MGPLFRTEDEKLLPRGAVQAMIERSARALNMPEGDLGTHSLRFGGASAIWAAYRGERPGEEMGQVGLRLVPDVPVGLKEGSTGRREKDGHGGLHPRLIPWRVSRPGVGAGNLPLSRSVARFEPGRI